MRPVAGLLPILAVMGGPVAAQSPPPRPLPASVTGAVAPTGVTPTASTQIAAPIQRFQDFRTLPAESVQSLYGMRTAAEWLWRMNLPNGRFLPGLNPALKQPLPDERDFPQVVACWGLAKAARFTGDEKLQARVLQAALALLTRTKPADGVRAPTTTMDGDCPVAFAAGLSLALRELADGGEARWADAADELAGYVRKCQSADGSFRNADAADAKPVDHRSPAAGLALQSLVAALVRKPDAAVREAVQRGLTFYRAPAATEPVLAGAMLPAVAALHRATQAKPVAALGMELVDAVVGRQLARNTARSDAWVGGFVPSADAGREPGIECAWCVQGLAAAGALARAEGDVSRFAECRRAAAAGVLFLRNLQYTDENADHFEKAFRQRYVAGGVHPTGADGGIRADGTAALALAAAAYLDAYGDAKAE